MIAAYPLDDIWPVILPEITALRSRFPRFCDWTEDDVLQACQRRAAMVFSNDEDRSFVIVKMRGDALFIWIGYCESGKSGINFQMVKEIARNVGAKRIEWESPRKGFLRWTGCRAVSETDGMTTYSMEV